MSNYFLKNSNLLEEIHKSKLTYCCYEDEKYTKDDIIFNGYNLILPNEIISFFNNHPERDDIIIRIMTSEHIENNGKSMNNGKINIRGIRFPPFKFFRLTKKDFYKCYLKSDIIIENISQMTDNVKKIKDRIKDIKKDIRYKKMIHEDTNELKLEEVKCEKEISKRNDEIEKNIYKFTKSIKKYLVEVLRSHWKGETIESGSFCTTQGKLTDNLVHMLFLFVEKLATSKNWARYTYKDDMIGSALLHLSFIVLNFNEAITNNAFSYLTQSANSSFTATINSEKIQRTIKSKLLQDAGYDPTYNEQLESELEWKDYKE